jgi:hypothetical protein
MNDLVDEREMIRLLRMRAEILRISDQPDADRRLARWLLQRRGNPLWKDPPRFGAPAPRRATQKALFLRRGFRRLRTR